MWIVDSSVWIDFFSGTPSPEADLLNDSLGQQELAIGDLILYEVLQGFSVQDDFDRAHQALNRLPIYNMCSPEIALQSALNHQKLVQRGVSVRKTVNSLIATFVIENDYWLLHYDRDFDPFAEHLGLQVVPVD